jgi:hypothetical protein
MSQRILRGIALMACTAVALSLAGLWEQQAAGQGTAAPGAGTQAPAGGQAPGGRGADGGRGGGRGGPPPGPPPTARASATVDLTGYWVSLITEDWRWRMKVPNKGDVASIPFTQDAATRAILQGWDPAKDEAAGEQCKSYGAAAIMRVPTRVRFTWENENVLKLETDAGTQTRLFHFGAAAQPVPVERTWQGFSVAEWEPSAAGGRGGRGGGPGGPGGGFPGGAAAAADGDAVPPLPPGGPAAAGPPVRGALKTVTTNLKPGYLRKNGVPYSDKTTVTEYFHRTPETYGITYMVVTTIVEDPEYLTGPFITSAHFKKLPETANGWDPTPCSVQ